SVVIETGVDDKIVFNDFTGDRTATIAPGTYYLRGDGEAGDLLAAIVAALDAAPGSTLEPWMPGRLVRDADPENLPATVLPTPSGGPYTLKRAGSTFDFLLLGLDFESTLTGDKTVISNVTPSCVWVPTDVYHRFRPRYPSRAAQSVTRSGVVRTA